MLSPRVERVSLVLPQSRRITSLLPSPSFTRAALGSSSLAKPSSTPRTSRRPIGTRAPRSSRSTFKTRCSSTSAQRQPISFQSSPATSRQSATATRNGSLRGNLVLTGMPRSFVMSMASRAPFRGAWTPLMNEYFASSADVHRILGDLPDGADKMATADGREKSVEASRARLARMIGRETDEGAASEWDGLAAWFAEAQLRQITDAALLRLSCNDVATAAPVVAAGVGESLAAEAARRLRRPCLGFSSLISAPAEASHCAPAVAVALLGANREAVPS